MLDAVEASIEGTSVPPSVDATEALSPPADESNAPVVPPAGRQRPQSPMPSGELPSGTDSYHQRVLPWPPYRSRGGRAAGIRRGGPGGTRLCPESREFVGLEVCESCDRYRHWPEASDEEPRECWHDWQARERSEVGQNDSQGRDVCGHE